MEYIVIGFSRKRIVKILLTNTTFDAVHEEHKITIEPGIDETEIFPVASDGTVQNDPSNINLVWQVRAAYTLKMRRKNEEGTK